MEIKNIIYPLMVKMEVIDSKISTGKTLRPAYYRNETGVLPYTKLGDIFLYDSVKIEETLRKNSI
jgi:hypothetical protein